MLTIATYFLAAAVAASEPSGLTFTSLPGKPCIAPPLSAEDYHRFADSLEASQGKQPSESGYPGLAGEVAAVLVARACVTVIALSWDGELDGGLLFEVDGASGLIAEPLYHGARSVRSAGSGRILLTYTSAKGSGLYESRYVVLCALHTEVWVACFEATASKSDRVSGLAPGDSSGFGMMMEQEAKIAIRGDTLLLTRSLRYQRYGEATRKADLGTSRLLLPRW
jgi:hypothetical protein